MNAASYREHLTVLISAKHKSSSAVLGKAGIKHETCLLVESTVFCQSLFPTDKVKEIQDLAIELNRRGREKQKRRRAISALSPPERKRKGQ